MQWLLRGYTKDSKKKTSHIKEKAMGRLMKKLRHGVGSLIIGTLIMTQSTCYATETKPAQNEKFFDMTKEQWIADYEYLWQTLRENYAFFGVAERDGVDVEGIYAHYKEMLEKSETEKDFYSAIYSAMWQMGQYGHLCFLEPDFYKYMKEVSSDIYGSDPNRIEWDKTLKAPQTVAGYEKLDQMYRAYGFYGENENEQADISPEKHTNVSTCELIKGQVAYMKIDNFDYEQIEADQKVIYDFYKQVADDKHLIIDLTANGGGSDNYWMSLLVAPLLKEATSASNYALIKGGENNKRFYENAFSKEALKDVKELPNLPKLNRQDLDGMKYMIESDVTVEPSEATPLFKGKIWVLTSDNIYSSSESFVQYCKATGFATLVGNTTGGDGGGIDPVYITLPNSGLIVRYSMLYTLNYDGSNSEECGTTPDICSVYGENPLVTCLKAISKK